MAIPATATPLPQTMDPYDRVDFQIDLADKLLELNETIASYDLVMGVEGAATGVSISSVAPHVTTTVNGATSVKFWLEVAPAFQADPAFTAGLFVPLLLSILTSASPPRRRQRTFVAEIVQL